MLGCVGDWIIARSAFALCGSKRIGIGFQASMASASDPEEEAERFLQEVGVERRESIRRAGGHALNDSSDANCTTFSHQLGSVAEQLRASNTPKMASEFEEMQSTFAASFGPELEEEELPAQIRGGFRDIDRPKPPGGCHRHGTSDGGDHRRAGGHYDRWHVPRGLRCERRWGPGRVRECQRATAVTRLILAKLFPAAPPSIRVGTGFVLRKCSVSEESSFSHF